MNQLIKKIIQCKPAILQDNTPKLWARMEDLLLKTNPNKRFSALQHSFLVLNNHIKLEMLRTGQSQRLTSLDSIRLSSDQQSTIRDWFNKAVVILSREGIRNDMAHDFQDEGESDDPSKDTLEGLKFIVMPIALNNYEYIMRIDCTAHTLEARGELATYLKIINRQTNRSTILQMPFGWWPRPFCYVVSSNTRIVLT